MPPLDPSGYEPLSFWTYPDSLPESLIHGLHGRKVVDTTVLDCKWALMCVKKNFTYVGICMTEKHLAWCESFMTRKTLELMKTLGNCVTNNRYIAALDDVNKKPKPRPSEPKAKAKAKTKAAATPPAGTDPDIETVGEKAVPKAKSKSRAKAKAKPAGADDADGAKPAGSGDGIVEPLGGANTSESD